MVRLRTSDNHVIKHPLILIPVSIQDWAMFNLRKLTIQCRIESSYQNSRSTLIVILPERTRLPDRCLAVRIEVPAQTCPYRYAFISYCS
jgi:hypothetical protein